MVLIMNLDENVQQVLIGSLLGDGGIYHGKRYRNALFVESHSLKQSDYLKWKAGILIKHFGGAVFPYTKISSPRKGLTLQTRTSPILTEFRHRWYPNGKKIIPREDIERLGSLGLAVWYEDDGSYDYRDRRCALAAADFKDQELFIHSFFNDRLDLNPSIRSGSVRFSVRDSDKFLRLIAEHIHPSMTYKLGHLCPANQTRFIEAQNRRLQYARKYWQINRDKILLYQRQYRYKNRERLRPRWRKYWRNSNWGKNRERILQRKREYYRRNREIILERRREGKRT